MRMLTVFGVIAMSAVAIGCASRSSPIATQISGSPSPTGCDGWFEIGGTFNSRNDLRFTLENRSSNVDCIATRVLILFSSAIRTPGISVSAPSGWRSREVRCASGDGKCGYEWSAVEQGVPKGGRLGGFGMTYIQTEQPYLKSWIIDLGRRRVEMPIGTVSGLAGSM